MLAGTQKACGQDRCICHAPSTYRSWLVQTVTPQKRQGSSGLQPHVSQTHSVRHPTHKTAANPKGTEKNSTSERGQAQIRVVPTNRPEIPGMKCGWEEGRGLPSRHVLGRSLDWAEPLRKSVWVSTRHPGVAGQAICLVSLKPFSTRRGLDGRKQAPGFPTTKDRWTAVHLV